MRLRVILPVTLAALFALAACGGTTPKASPKTSPGVTTVTYAPAGTKPSISAQMVCSKEARKDMVEPLGMPAIRVTTPTWHDHIYSCTYIYPKGSFVLAVKELVDEKSTTDYFNAQKAKLGSKDNLFGLGQGAFVAKNDDVVVRKDYKVLLVDVKNVPKAEGAFIPAMARSDVATNVAAVIMSCWAGA